jgi:hypothetical protein
MQASAKVQSITPVKPAPPLTLIRPARLTLRVDPRPALEPECECQDVERCPVHFGYD